MRIDRFEMERTQCLYENQVEFNLSESGVHPLTMQELVEGDQAKLSALLGLGLRYDESDGSLELRERIASFYPGASAENVVVSHGTSEANYTTFWGMLDRDGRAAVMLPNYLQTWGLARAFAQRADPFRLVPTKQDGRLRWALDLDSLRKAVSSRTRLILITNPNNPTGTILTEDEVNEVIRIARRVGAWIVSDEVYRGAEVRSTQLTPTFWGRYNKVIITAGLSKAFGLPGLRIGWIVAPKKTVAQLWSYQDYTTITPAILSDRLARIALEPAHRDRIIARTRGILARQLPQLEAWIHTHPDVFDYIPPQAGAIVLLKYRLPIAPTRLFERLRLEHSVLIPTGPQFGLTKYVRIGYGYDIKHTLAGLARFDTLIDQLLRRRPARTSRPRLATASA
jgi:aspartate/methionine/tyrosine aminotransferase